MIEIMPVHTDNILKHWGRFTEGMKRIKPYCRNDESIQGLYNSLMKGLAIMWLIFKDENYAGFIITEFIQAEFLEKRLLVREMYSKINLTLEDINEGMQSLDMFAKSFGVSRMEMYTVRDKAFERKFGQLGWKPKQVVFEREVK